MKKYLLSFLVLFFVLSFGSAFAYNAPYNTAPENVKLGNATFTLPNKYVVFRTNDNNTVSCGNESTGEIITFAIKDSERNIDLNSNAAIQAVRNVAAKMNSNILKIERFDLNGKIIITTKEQNNRGEHVKAYFFWQGNLYLISFTQFPPYGYGELGFIENYEQARNLLLFIINSVR